jgi:hypothetical protein
MPMPPISLNELRAYAKTLQGRTLTTAARKKEFAVEVKDNGLIYTPASTRRSRFQHNKHIVPILERFNTTRSFTPSEYHDLTVNASYVLAVISSYREQ